MPIDSSDVPPFFADATDEELEEWRLHVLTRMNDDDSVDRYQYEQARYAIVLAEIMTRIKSRQKDTNHVSLSRRP